MQLVSIPQRCGLPASVNTSFRRALFATRFPNLVSAVAAALLVLLNGCQDITRSAPHVISGYQSFRGASGGIRPGEHAGVDFSGRYGEPVLAAADGVVYRIAKSRGACGNGVTLIHFGFSDGPFTVYCHLNKVAVKEGKRVKRGEQIGFVGTSGNSADVPHVHFEVSVDGYSHRSGEVATTSNPLQYMVGCFVPAKIYDDTGTFPLTYPLTCAE